MALALLLLGGRFHLLKANRDLVVLYFLLSLPSVVNSELRTTGMGSFFLVLLLASVVRVAKPAPFAAGLALVVASYAVGLRVVKDNMDLRTPGKIVSLVDYPIQLVHLVGS